MGTFVGRESELSFLESIWNGHGPRACMVVGRRGIGKTELLRRFSEDKRTVFVSCINGSIPDNIHAITGAMKALDGLERHDPGSLMASLNCLLEMCRESKTLVVIDELPYLISSGREASSVVQHFVDSVNGETESMVVVCGSSIDAMMRETASYRQPLYGRFLNRIVMEPLTLRECSAFHPDMPDLEQLKLYLTVGGIPAYHSDPEASTFREYIERHFLSQNADLADVAGSLIGSELAPLGRYLSVLNAISDGAASLKNISEKSAVERTACSRCLEDLRNMEIVGTVHPMMGSPKQPVYRIIDPLTAFCQSMVRESRAYALKGPAEVFDILSQDIHMFLERRFEDLCTEYVKNSYRCIEIGRWWGIGYDKSIREVGIAAKILIGDSTAALFGTCELGNRKMASGALKKLMEDCELVKTDLSKKYILFSASGFTEDLIDEGEEFGIELVGLEKLFGRNGA